MSGRSEQFTNDFTDKINYIGNSVITASFIWLLLLRGFFDLLSSVFLTDLCFLHSLQFNALKKTRFDNEKLKKKTRIVQSSDHHT